MLLLNWNEKSADFVQRIDEVCPSGSRITVVSEERPDDMASLRLQNCRFTYVAADPSSATSLAAARPQDYETVVWLQPEGGGEEDDSALLVAAMAIKQVLRNAGVAKLPRIVSEVSSPDMKELLTSRFDKSKSLEGSRSDILLPDELASGVLVQFAISPDLIVVYNELLEPEGKEIFMAPASLYAAEGEELTFGSLYARARARGEVAMGLRLKGAGTQLNPPMSTKVTLSTGDKLVMLGEAF